MCSCCYITDVHWGKSIMCSCCYVTDVHWGKVLCVVVVMLLMCIGGKYYV